MTKIAIFDSGVGSLSIVKPLQKIMRSEIIYYADQKNFPYGKKSKKELRKIINYTIHLLEKKFNLDLIIVASNTPSLLLNLKENSKVVGVFPPLKEAAKLSHTSNIAILATKSVIDSKELTNYIKKNYLPKRIKIHKINVSSLVDLVESGKFITHKNFCKTRIRKILRSYLINNKIDVVTLSSTHLPFLRPLLENEFPNITFLDPADSVAKKILKMIKTQSKRNSLKIFTTSDPKKFQSLLKRMKIRTPVTTLD
jgi:glutamate racemase